MLWKIEESFRIMKSSLEVQPVFHWNEDRIRGHFVVCFLAFLMERQMELLLKSENDDEEDQHISSPDRIREALTSMQFAAVTTDNREVFIKAKSAPIAKKIFKKLGLKMPANINEKSGLIDLYNHLEEPFETQLSIF